MIDAVWYWNKRAHIPRITETSTCDDRPKPRKYFETEEFFFESLRVKFANIDQFFIFFFNLQLLLVNFSSQILILTLQQFLFSPFVK